MSKDINVVTTSEAAASLKVHPKTIARLMRIGKLPAFKVANRWLIDKDTFNTFSKTYIGKRGRPKGWSPQGGK
jgi:excisionase family DNA binding protein